MNQLFKHLGLNAPIPGLFGIEIEAEGEGMSEVKNKYWRTESDGSLRGEYPSEAAEFVLKNPISAEQVKPALESLVKALDGAKFDFSYRTSVHVHVNVQELTHVQLLNFIYVYLLLEEPLMTYCGKSRKGNRFCLRLADAEGMLDVIQALFQQVPSAMGQCGDNVRYSAINLAALNKYGSLEFRAMRGCLDVEVIHTWTKALGKLREFAMQVKDPKEILALLQKFGAEMFTRNIMGDLYETFTYPRILRDIARSFSISLDLPYSYNEVKEHKQGDRINTKVAGGIPRNPVEGMKIDHNGKWYIFERGDWQAEKKPAVARNPVPAVDPAQVARMAQIFAAGNPAWQVPQPNMVIDGHAIRGNVVEAVIMDDQF